jgi:hypothetical protein
MSTAAEIARKAAEIASERGHCKGMEEDEHGNVCFIGAVNIAYCGQSERGDTYDCPEVFDIIEAAARVLARREGLTVLDGINYMYSHGPINYNNKASTSREDIILLLKEAAEELEQW